MKVLTFVIPAYNSEAYLDKCISSMILPDQMSRLEILVVNDGSTDRTAQIAEKYRASYPESIRAIAQENKGHGGALNTGCAAARGKYLKVIDADDWVETESLARLISFLEKTDSDVVLTHHRTIDIQTGEIMQWKSFPAEFGIPYTFEEIMRDWKSFDRSLTFHGIIYRTVFYQKHETQLPEHVYYEDHQYATFPCCYACSITPFDLFLYDYRIGDLQQSVSEANQLKRIGDTETVLRSMIQAAGSLQCGDGGRAYAAMKVQGLLLSYLTTALLVEPDRRKGRALARNMAGVVREGLPTAYHRAEGKYRVFLLMSRLHVTKRTWDRILHSKLYNRLRGNHDF